ncbi:MAG: LysM peptidoglycan-binding domain-containing protein [Gallionellaceae bacterium]
MQKFIISLICILLSALAYADTSEILDNAPDQHIVVKGDTLWDISATFYKSPWKWQQIWGLNKDTIKDPHWIYPGDVIILNRTTGTLQVQSPMSSNSVVVNLSPKVQVEKSEHDAIPSIPASAIGPFLSQPLVIEDKNLPSTPSLIVATFERRVLLTTNDIAYAQGLSADKGLYWQIYRPGKELIDPDTNEKLGVQVFYLGDAQVEKFDNISTIRITKAVQEINKGDRLIPASGEIINNYIPHAPDTQVSARVISIYGGVSEAGQGAIVTINKGRRDGMENGHVLALYRKGEEIRENGKNLSLPDVRYGLLLVFRVFDKVSYALVMQTALPVELLDRALTP